MGLKDRMKRADPLGRMLGSRPDTNIRQFIATGGVAGDIAVTGLRRGDKIIAVTYRLTAAGNLVDMTADFGSGVGEKRGNGATLTRDNVINNTGGTTTASGQIIVLVESFDVR